MYAMPYLTLKDAEESTVIRLFGSEQYLIAKIERPNAGQISELINVQ